MVIKNNFRKKGFAPGLVLKQRLAASRKWPIGMVNLRISCKLDTGDTFLLFYLWLNLARAPGLQIWKTI